MSSRGVLCHICKALITLLTWLTVGLIAFTSVWAADDFEAATIPAQLPTDKLKKNNPAVTISVASALQTMKLNKHIPLVDMRNSDQFRTWFKVAS